VKRPWAVIGAGSLVGAILLGGCGFPPDIVFPFKVVNNAHSDLVFEQCGNTCNEIHEVDTVAPRGTAEYNAADGSIEQDILIITTHH
jgi:hypothetical protein